MKLTIDNKPIYDFDTNTDAAITFSIASITDIDKEKTGYTKTIKIPITPNTRSVFGFPEDVHSITFFNQINHDAIIDDDDIILISGSVMLQKSEVNFLSSGYYHINIIGAGKQWAVDASIKKLSEINISFGQVFTEQTILDSWEGDNTVVRWLPVIRAPFSYIEDRKEITRSMNIWDYHPFINIETIFRQIFKDAGYTIVSTWIDNKSLNEHYFSGYLNRADIEEQKKDWDFYAGRFFNKDITGSAETIKIGVEPGSLNGTPIVDTSNPDEPRGAFDDGEGFDTYVDKAFEHKGIIRGQLFDNSCSFFATADISVGFDINVNFYTQVEYATHLTGEYFGVNPIYRTNAYYYREVNYSDRQGVNITKFLDYTTLKVAELTKTENGAFYVYGKGSFLIELPEYDADLVLRIGWASGGWKYAYFQVTDKYTLISSDNNIQYVDVFRKSTGEQIYTGITPYSVHDDLDIEVKFSIDPQKIPANGYYYFDQLIFYRTPGVQLDLDFTYLISTNITPVFPLTGIGIGDTVTPDLILSNQVTQAAFLRAVKHLFNLNFYTDVFKKIVFIEPRDDFYSGPVIDWSDKIDLSNPIEIEELGADMNRIFSIGYGEADYSVKKFNEENKTELGRFNTEIENKFAKTDENVYKNEMFSPSIVKAEDYPPAVSAKLLHVYDDSNDLAVNFDARVVKYIGVRDLPVGESLGFPIDQTKYPLAVFSDVNEQVNLCFESRIKDDKSDGLHRHYDNNIRMYNRSKRITCYVHLKAVDIEPFAKLNLLKQDFRAKFKLKIDDEDVFCNLEDISDYKNGSESTKCVFVKRI